MVRSPMTHALEREDIMPKGIVLEDSKAIQASDFDKDYIEATDYLAKFKSRLMKEKTKKKDY